MLNIQYLIDADFDNLADIIRPSGFFNQKTERLKTISNFLKNKFDSNLNKFFNQEIKYLRNQLLSLKGIGPETADSIILYAGKKPIFVIDAYTIRLCERIPIKLKIKYDDIQDYFEKNLNKSFKTEELVNIYNEFHALIVNHAKIYCKKKPNCYNCPLKKQCKFFKKLF